MNNHSSPIRLLGRIISQDMYRTYSTIPVRTKNGCLAYSKWLVNIKCYFHYQGFVEVHENISQLYSLLFNASK